MTRYRSYPSRPKKSSQRSDWGNLVLAVVLGVVGCTGLKLWLDSQPPGFSLAQLAQVSESVKQVANPNILVTTQRIQNPIAGQPRQFSAQTAARLDQTAKQIQYNGTSVEELALKIRQVANSDWEKARLAYSWITQNIAYDVMMAETRNIDDLRPETVLARRETICSGYANLYQALAKALGLDAVIIEGFGKGGDFIVGDDPDVNHAWNGVKINDQWYLLDATWGAGSVNKGQFQFKFNPHYFATEPKQLVVSHFPRESQWQLLSTPYTRLQFDQLPALTPHFFRDQFALESHQTKQIRTGGDLDLTLRAGPNIQVVAKLQTQSGQDVEENYTLSQNQGDQVTIKAAFPQPGDYKLLILSKNANEETYYQAIAYDVSAQGIGEPFPKTYGSFTEHQVKLISPLRRSLPLNQASYFQLQVPGAEKVMLVDRDRRKFTPLTRTGDIFTGSEIVNSPNLMVAAQFPGNDKFWTLVEYE
jgi:transglutaminase/protease-like cytokinesis protein 3